jgi:pimeloyl-ACP methyl ester carboxylesterase
MGVATMGEGKTVDSSLARSTAHVNGVDIFYRDAGTAGRSILCLHGRWGRGETWTGLISRYKDRFRVIAPDQRGHGLSGKPEGPYTAEAMAADAHELMRHLGCLPAIVVGHSMGGRVAAYLAALYPGAVRAVAIVDETAAGPEEVTYKLVGEDLEDDGLTSEWPTPYKTYDEALAHLSGRFKLDTNVRYFLESLAETPEGYDFLFSRRAMAAIARAYRSWHDILRKIECPALLVRAADSWCLSERDAANMRETIASCAYYEVSGSDHMVYADNPDEFYAGFDDFIGGLK